MTEKQAWEIINDPNNFTDELEDYSILNVARKTAMDALCEVEQYRAIGTIPVCKDAMEKQKRKEAKINIIDQDIVYIECPRCGSTTASYHGTMPHYCPACGQAILYKDGINIEPRKPTDQGGYYCMPLKKNVPQGHDNWKPAVCPECGRECWRLPLADVAEASGAKPLCTECALKKGVKHD